MGKFSKTLKATKIKTNNHPAAGVAKAEIRRNVFACLHRDDVPAAVFDAFAGDGAMYREVWKDAPIYAGCDMTWYRDERRMYVADNRVVLRAIDLRRFNIFDLDAWGSPWEQALIVCARRPVAPGERLGLLLTEGSGLKVKMGGLPHALRNLAGMRPGARLAGAGRAQDELIDRAIAGLCRRMNVQVLRRWQANGKTGAAMRYIGLVLEGIVPAAPGDPSQ
jgi:hypothetical protein